jgi:hypothetical protein
VLAVRDNELAVGDDDDALSEVAERKAHVGELSMDGKARIRQASSSLLAFLATAGTDR